MLESKIRDGNAKSSILEGLVKIEELLDEFNNLEWVAVESVGSGVRRQRNSKQSLPRGATKLEGPNPSWCR